MTNSSVIKYKDIYPIFKFSITFAWTKFSHNWKTLLSLNICSLIRSECLLLIVWLHLKYSHNMQVHAINCAAFYINCSIEQEQCNSGGVPIMVIMIELARRNKVKRKVCSNPESKLPQWYSSIQFSVYKSLIKRESKILTKFKQIITLWSQIGSKIIKARSVSITLVLNPFCLLLYGLMALIMIIIINFIVITIFSVTRRGIFVSLLLR